MSRMFLLLLGVLSATAGAARYPVDEEIEALQAKARYLETLKNAFEANACAIEVDGNRVALAPGALRSEGLVMAIGAKFPGQYLAFHKAPKPQFLRNVVNMTLLKGDVGADAVVVGTRLAYEADGATPSQLLVFVAKPEFVEGTDGLWLYNKTFLKVPFPEAGKSSEADGALKDGRKIRLTCN